MEEKARESSNEENDKTIFVGSKPLMNYVTGVVMQFTTLNRPEVIVKARGKFITKAVDISQVAVKKLLTGQNVFVDKTEINSEEFTNKEGRLVRVSTIEIFLGKK
ncbi:MAG: DNA-binding protein [Nanoarchaeota archaeon]|nr:DNA-binding protein [Nanoarchaeota archaeon]